MITVPWLTIYSGTWNFGTKLVIPIHSISLRKQVKTKLAATVTLTLQLATKSNSSAREFLTVNPSRIKSTATLPYRQLQETALVHQNRPEPLTSIQSLNQVR